MNGELSAASHAFVENLPQGMSVMPGCFDLGWSGYLNLDCCGDFYMGCPPGSPDVGCVPDCFDLLCPGLYFEGPPHVFCIP